MPGPAPSPTPTPRRFSRAWVIAAIVLIIIIVSGGLWWWYNRPIQPVVLDAQETAVVEAKIEAIQQPEKSPDDDRVYEKGKKEIVLTQRELNGLLNRNTGLGESLKFELARNAIHARVETDLDPGLPVVGGKRLKARARFFIHHEPGNASLVLDDVTVWGISLPNDWLAGFKGRDLLGELAGGGISGVDELKVEPGKLTVRLKE